MGYHAACVQPVSATTWTVICSGAHRDHFGSVYHSYGTPSRTAFEIPAATAARARRICEDAGLYVIHVFE